MYGSVRANPIPNPNPNTNPNPNPKPNPIPNPNPKKISQTTVIHKNPTGFRDCHRSGELAAETRPRQTTKHSSSSGGLRADRPGPKPGPQTRHPGRVSRAPSPSSLPVCGEPRICRPCGSESLCTSSLLLLLLDVKQNSCFLLRQTRSSH